MKKTIQILAATSVMFTFGCASTTDSAKDTQAVTAPNNNVGTAEPTKEINAQNEKAKALPSEMAPAADSQTKAEEAKTQEVKTEIKFGLMPTEEGKSDDEFEQDLKSLESSGNDIEPALEIN